MVVSVSRLRVYTCVSVQIFRQLTHNFNHDNPDPNTEQGAIVTAHYNTNPTTLEPLLKEFGRARVRAAQADLSLEPDVSRLFAAPADAFGPVQVLVVNHGWYRTSATPLAQMSLAQWDETTRANLTSCFLVVREYLRRLEGAEDGKKERAAVVLVGSTAGKYGEASHADYAASKSGESSVTYLPDVIFLRGLMRWCC